MPRRILSTLGFLGMAIAMVMFWRYREPDPARSGRVVTNEESTHVINAPSALSLVSNTPVVPNRPTEEVVGIGAALTMAKEPVAGTLRIQAVVKGSPAEKAGLTEGLIIESIDGTKTFGLSLRECVKLIRGSAGSKVQLEVVDPVGDDTNTVELTREKVRVQFEAAP